MYYAVNLDLPPDLPAEVGAAQRAHFVELTAKGILMLSGPFTDRQGGMAVLSAASLDEATAIYSETPLARSGLITWRIREWDARAGVLAAHLPTG
jgi:uncharacterized protein